MGFFILAFSIFLFGLGAKLFVP